jgi:hypothetical protein
MQDGLEGVEALRVELQAADDALHEVRVMMDDLKALVAKLSQSEEVESTSNINSSSSDRSVPLRVSGLSSFDEFVWH